MIARQVATVQRLVDTARSAADTDEAILHWLGVQRQCRRHMSWLATRPRSDEETALHRALLEDAAGEARARLGVDPAAVESARSRLGVRVAVIGKGGAGKSLISGTLARLLARRGRPVLAADLDTNPGLAYSLGVPPGAGMLPDDVLTEHPGASYGWGLRDGLAPADVVERSAVVGPDGVRFVSLGKIGDLDKDAPKRTVVALCELLTGFGEPGWDVVGDLEAGPTTPFERYHSFADHALVVVTPTWVSAMTARRLRPIVDDVDVSMVANQVADGQDPPGVTPAFRIPFDPEAAAAERRGLAPLDACPDSPAVAAIGRLADALTRQEVPA